VQSQVIPSPQVQTETLDTIDMAPILSRLADIYGLTFSSAGAAGGGASGLTATGGIISDYEVSGTYYRAHIFTSSGTFDVTELGSFGNTVEYVVVAGGGSGSTQDGYGGGGAGGYRSSVIGESSGGGNSAESVLPVSVSSYPVQIGAGARSAGPPAAIGFKGSNTVFGSITAEGGGYGAGQATGAGGAGGSGGGSGDYPRGGRPGPATNYPGPTAQGFPGGQGASDQATFTAGGGGGGAGGSGETFPNGPNPSASIGPNGGNGGNGVRTLIAGPGPTGAGAIGTPGPGSPGGNGGGTSGVVNGGWLAGGGAGFRNSTLEPGVGGAGGGGFTGNGSPPYGKDGVASTGGGGASSYPGASGAGGSGIVVVRYQIGQPTAEAKATGGVVSFYDGKTIHTLLSTQTFASLPTWQPNTPVEYVIVASGGGGGNGGGAGGGGGGAGGYTDGTTSFSGPFSFPVTVGAGGRGSASYLEVATRGNPSSAAFPTGTITATYGGYGGGYHPGGGSGGGPGANGGGGGYPGGSGGTGTQNSGGNGLAPVTAGGGGGGAGVAPGGVGETAQPTRGGNGGRGVQLPTTFRDPAQTIGAIGPGGEYFWVAGGGGGGENDTSYAGYGGNGPQPVSTISTQNYAGGGRGESRPEPFDTTQLEINGLANTGGGGGGACTMPGGYGGSGIVLIAYPT